MDALQDPLLLMLFGWLFQPNGFRENELDPFEPENWSTDEESGDEEVQWLEWDEFELHFVGDDSDDSGYSSS